LNPLDLTWRVIDAQTLEVITPSRLAEHCELELYKVEDLVVSDPTGESLLAKVRAATGAGDGGESAAGQIRFDLDGKCLIAWLPQPKQRQVESLLTALHSEGKKERELLPSHRRRQ